MISIAGAGFHSALHTARRLSGVPLKKLALREFVCTSFKGLKFKAHSHSEHERSLYTACTYLPHSTLTQTQVLRMRSSSLTLSPQHTRHTLPRAAHTTRSFIQQKINGVARAAIHEIFQCSFECRTERLLRARLSVHRPSSTATATLSHTYTLAQTHSDTIAASVRWSEQSIHTAFQVHPCIVFIIIGGASIQ